MTRRRGDTIIQVEMYKRCFNVPRGRVNEQSLPSRGLKESAGVKNRFFGTRRVVPYTQQQQQQLLLPYLAQFMPFDP